MSLQKRSPAPRANAGNRANQTRPCINIPPTAEAQASRKRGGPIDFAKINGAALAAFPVVLKRLLPNGKNVGREFEALNPRRADRKAGSFRINRYNGKWADFAAGESGGDPVSLVAYLTGTSQGEAARLLAQMLGFEVGGRK
jgi:hypothetical protein